MVNSKIRSIIFFAVEGEEHLCSKQKKKRPGADCGSDHGLISKFRLKLKKVGKMTRPDMT